MPVVIVIAIALLLGIVMLARLIAAHPVFLLYAMGAAPVVLAITILVLKGAARHAVIAWSPPRAVTRDSMLPLPAAPQAAGPPTSGAREPFSSSSAPAWDALIEQAERDELMRAAPREARVVRPRCEGPGCRERLDGNPWVIQVQDRGHEEDHSFCSRECAEDWQDQDAEERSGRRRS